MRSEAMPTRQLDFRSSRHPPHRSGTTMDWELANADAASLNHHDATESEGIFNRRQIGQQQGGLPVWSVTGDTPQQKHRWLRVFAQRKQGSEIRIGRNQ